MSLQGYTITHAATAADWFFHPCVCGRGQYASTSPTVASYCVHDDAKAGLAREQAESSPSSRAVSAPVLPPAPASTPASARNQGLSPAKTSETSEGVRNQAGNGAGLIMELLITVADSPQVLSGQSVTTHSTIGQVYVDALAPGAGVVGRTYPRV